MRRREISMTLAMIGLMVGVAHQAKAFQNPFSEERRNPKVIVVLFDHSESTAKEAIRTRYLNDFKSIIDPDKFGRLGFRDAIYADRITGNSFSNASFKIQAVLDEEALKLAPGNDNPTVISARIKKKLPELLKKLGTAAEELLSEKPSNTTDIMGALNAVEQLFNNYDKNYRKKLVIMSDMLEFSKDYQFDKASLNENEINTIIHKEKNLKRLPNLEGVEVFVIGAGGANREKSLAVRNFWVQYFKATGAILDTKNYGAPVLSAMK